MMEQKTVQSFKITNIRQLDHEGQVTETETPVTRQQLAKVLSETIIGVDIEQFEDHWAGNPQIDINLFEEHDKPGQYRANVYKVEIDEKDMMYQGDCIADFDIELFTDRNDDLLLQCENCGEILTLSELEDSDDYEHDMSDYRTECEPGSIIPFGEHSAGDCWGMIHEFDYSKLVKQAEPEPIKVWVSIRQGEFFDAYTTYANDGKVEVEVWDWDNIGQADRKDEANEAWALVPWSPETIKKTYCAFEQQRSPQEDAWNNWPEEASYRYNAPLMHNFKVPFTEINGIKIAPDSVENILVNDSEHVSDEAMHLDAQFGYYVPFEVMCQGDQAVYDYIKAHIDENFPGERPE